MKKEYIVYVTKVSHRKLRKSTYWATGSGEEILIKDIEFNHLINIIKYLLKAKEESLKYDLPMLEFETFSLEKWIEVLKNELNFRK